MGERRSAAVKRRTGSRRTRTATPTTKQRPRRTLRPDEADEDDEDDEGDDDKAGALKYRGLLRADIDRGRRRDSEGGGGEEDDERDDGQNYGYRSYSESEEE